MAPESVQVSADNPPVSRKIYRYSVVPGGVYNREELGRARRSDSVVWQHYRSFSDTPEFVRAEKPLLVYVSYRKNNQVYWTHNRHHVNQGEVILVDHQRMARARCGNQLSLTPQGPVEDSEPSEDVLSSNEPPKLPLVEQLVAPALPADDLAGADLYVPAANPAPDTAASTGATPGPAPPSPIAYSSAGGPGFAGGFPYTITSTPRSIATFVPASGASGVTRGIAPGLPVGVAAQTPEASSLAMVGVACGLSLLYLTFKRDAAER